MTFEQELAVSPLNPYSNVSAWTVHPFTLLFEHPPQELLVSVTALQQAEVLLTTTLTFIQSVMVKVAGPVSHVADVL